MSTRSGKQKLASPDDPIIAAEFVLGPCSRVGNPTSDTDWWVEKHVYCTGSQHLNTALVVRCTCPCHTDAASPEAQERIANEVHHDVRVTDEDARNGNDQWRRMRSQTPGAGELG